MRAFRRGAGIPAGAHDEDAAFVCGVVLLAGGEADAVNALHCPRVCELVRRGREYASGLDGASEVCLVSECVRLLARGYVHPSDGGAGMRAEWRALAATAPGSLRGRVSAAELELSVLFSLRFASWEDCLRAVLGRVPDSFLRRVGSLSREWGASDARAVMRACGRGGV